MLDFSDSDFYTLADAAALLGKKTDTLKKWFANGCPHKKNGRSYEVNLAAVFDWRIEYERELLFGGEEGQQAEFLNLEQERARLAKEQRLEKEMTNARLRGQLVDAEEVEKAWAEMIVACKTKMLSLGKKIAARLGVPNQRQVAEDISREIRSALRELTENAHQGSDSEGVEEV